MDASTTSDDPGIHPAWRLAEPWPATFVAPLAGAEHPEADAVLAAIATRVGDAVEVLELHPSIDEKHPWSLVARLPGHAVPVLLACERSKRMDDVRPDLATGVRAARWSLVVESLLDPADPVRSWATLASVIADEPSALALLDATTGRWFDRRELVEEALDSELGPGPDVLWQVQVVSTSEDLDAGTAWLFTRGLLRCGLPELELLELPGEHVRTGARLLDTVAELLVEEGPPPPEVPYPIGRDASVTLVPWTEVAATLDRESLGSDEDRRAMSQETPNPLRSRRAAVCDLEPRGSFRPVWSWPQAAISAMNRSDAAVRRSDSATARQAAIARRRWPEAVACRRAHPTETVLLVGTVVHRDTEGVIEHGWLQVDRADDLGGEGRLLRDTGAGERAGAVRSFTVEEIDEWRLVRGEAAVGPELSSTPRQRLFPEAVD